MHGGYYTAAAANGLNEGITLKDSTRVDLFGIDFNNAINAISIITASTFTPEITIAGDKYTSTVTTKYTYGTGVARHKISKLNKKVTYAIVDDSVTGISAAGSTTLYVDTNEQVKRFQFNTAAAYTYDINLSNDNAVEGDTFVIYTKLLSTYSTVNIKDGTGAIQLTLNTAKSYMINMVYTGSAWRCIGACESLV